MPCLAAAVVLGVLLSASLANGAEPASRIIDRTVLCRTAGIGYPDVVRIMNASALPFQAALGGGPSPPHMGVSNPAGGSNWVSAGMRTGPVGSVPTGELSLSRTRCQSTKLRIALSPKGLEGGPAEPFGSSYRCDVSTKILLRIRAVFTRPTRLVRNARFPDYLVARGNITSGSLAVTTLSGRKPIVFASVHDKTGQARIFVASRCRPE